MSSNLKRAATSAITPSGTKIPKLTPLTTPLPVANLFGSGSASLAGGIPVDCDNSPFFPLPCSQTEFSPFDYSPFGIYCQSCVQTLVLSPENVRKHLRCHHPALHNGRKFCQSMVSFFEAKIMESHTKGPSDIKNFTMEDNSSDVIIKIWVCGTCNAQFPKRCLNNA
jgi:hypothetical protein